VTAERRATIAALGGAVLLALTLGMQWSPGGALGRTLPTRLLVVAAIVAAVAAAVRSAHRSQLLAASAGLMAFSLLWTIRMPLEQSVLVTGLVAVALLLYARHGYARAA
jgi:hypothetical protein